jgi:hypothetical protein
VPKAFYILQNVKSLIKFRTFFELDSLMTFALTNNRLPHLNLETPDHTTSVHATPNYLPLTSALSPIPSDQLQDKPRLQQSLTASTHLLPAGLRPILSPARPLHVSMHGDFFKAFTGKVFGYAD